MLRATSAATRRDKVYGAFTKLSVSIKSLCVSIAAMINPAYFLIIE